MCNNWIKRSCKEFHLPRNSIGITLAMLSNKKLWYITAVLAKTGLPKIAILLIIAMI
jgi:hypothetical protein